jgi:hypothetical protein
MGDENVFGCWCARGFEVQVPQARSLWQMLSVRTDKSTVRLTGADGGFPLRCNRGNIPANETAELPLRRNMLCNPH